MEDGSDGSLGEACSEETDGSRLTVWLVEKVDVVLFGSLEKTTAIVNIHLVHTKFLSIAH